MSARRHSYSPASKPRQLPRACRGIAAIALALSLGGCAGLGLPFGSDLARVDTTTTGSIRPTLVSANVVDGVDASDWEAIRRTVAAVPADSSVDSLAWRNPDTGSAGTISSLGTAHRRGSLMCRAFATTVNDQRGVRRYRGEACQRDNGRWQLYGMAADDAQLS
jgi:surface antigen